MPYLPLELILRAASVQFLITRPPHAGLHFVCIQGIMKSIYQESMKAAEQFGHKKESPG